MLISVKSSGVSLHFEKHKGNDSSINGLQRHDERRKGQKHSNENIDDSKTGDNIFLKADDGLKYKKRIENIISKNRKNGLKGVRKDAVRMVECTVQLSGKILDKPVSKQIEVLKDSYEWAKDNFGEENMVSSVIHLDETNPHLHFGFVPIDEAGKLTAKTIISKSKLREYQKSSLEQLRSDFLSANFQRGGGEFNGLSQADFEKIQKERELREKELDEFEDELDKREDNLDEHKKALDMREEVLGMHEQEVNLKISKLDNAKDDFEAEKERHSKALSTVVKSVEQRELQVERQKRINEVKEEANKLESERLRKREDKITQKNLKASQKLSEASERLLEARRQEEANKLESERLTSLKAQMELIAEEVKEKLKKLGNSISRLLHRVDKPAGQKLEAIGKVKLDQEEPSKGLEATNIALNMADLTEDNQLGLNLEKMLENHNELTL